MSDKVAKTAGSSGVQKRPQVVVPEGLAMTKTEKRVHLARNGKRVKEYEDKNVPAEKIGVYVNHTIMDKGVSMEPTEITYLTTRIIADIFDSFPHFTLEEIRLAFHLGVRGELGEYYGLNAVSFFNFLKAYNDDVKSNVNLKVSKFEQQKKIEQKDTEKPSQKDIDAQFMLLLKDAVEDVKSGKTEFYNDSGNILYRWIDLHGAMPFSADEKKEMVKASKAFLKRRLHVDNMTLEKRKRGVQKINLKEAFEKINNDHEDYNTTVASGAMKIAVNEIIKRHISGKVDIVKKMQEILNKKSYGTK